MHSVVYDHQAFSLQRYGGVSRYICELATRVHRASDFTARIVAPVHFNSYLPDCPVPQTAMYLRKLWKTGPLYRAANNLLSPILMRASAPSLIHRTYFAPLAKPVDVPVILTVFDMIHELFPASFSAGDVTRRNKRVSVERADHILCISECTANDLTRQLDLPFLDLQETFTRDHATNAKRFEFPYDWHWNTHANRLVGAAVTRLLLEDPRIGVTAPRRAAEASGLPK